MNWKLLIILLAATVLGLALDYSARFVGSAAEYAQIALGWLLLHFILKDIGKDPETSKLENKAKIGLFSMLAVLFFAFSQSEALGISFVGEMMLGISLGLAYEALALLVGHK